MRIFDLSQPLTDGCPNCPVHPPVQLPRTADHPADGWRMEMFHMASHTGTHLDAPLHKLPGGASIDQLPLVDFCGETCVAEFPDAPADFRIGATELLLTLAHVGSLTDKIVLLNTGWGLKRAKSKEWLHHSPFLAPDGADWLVKNKIRGLGIDHFSIGGTREPDNACTHEILLGAGVWIVEELCFRDGWRMALPGATFQALPLNLPGFSGSPCRAVLLQPN